MKKHGTLVAAVALTAAAWAWPAAANHDGLFDLAALEQGQHVAAGPAATDDSHWLARLRSWLHEVVGAQ